VHAYIDPKKVASVRVAEHIGMHYEGEADFYGEPTGLYQLVRP
jgi:RimJ/RimL family protein N-acetyltransferase